MLVHRTVPLIIVHRAFHHFTSVLPDKIYRVLPNVSWVVRVRLVFVINCSICDVSGTWTVNLEFVRINVR